MLINVHLLRYRVNVAMGQRT